MSLSETYSHVTYKTFLFINHKVLLPLLSEKELNVFLKFLKKLKQKQLFNDHLCLLIRSVSIYYFFRRRLDTTKLLNIFIGVYGIQFQE